MYVAIYKVTHGPILHRFEKNIQLAVSTSYLSRSKIDVAAEKVQTKNMRFRPEFKSQMNLIKIEMRLYEKV